MTQCAFPKIQPARLESINWKKVGLLAQEGAAILNASAIRSLKQPTMKSLIGGNFLRLLFRADSRRADLRLGRCFS